ncbi:MAG: 3'-5' exonuclease [Calditrichia bacterium]
MVSEIFEESLYRATLAAEWNGEQMLANLDKLIEQIRDFEQSGFMALSDFIDSLRETLNLDPREGEAQIALEDESTVKIMTIHQSKGLEFPIVLLPYLSQQGKSNTAPYRFDAEWGLSAKWRNPLRNYEAEPPFLFNLIHERDKQKNLPKRSACFYGGNPRERPVVSRRDV